MFDAVLCNLIGSGNRFAFPAVVPRTPFMFTTPPFRLRDASLSYESILALIYRNISESDLIFALSRNCSEGSGFNSLEDISDSRNSNSWNQLTLRQGIELMSNRTSSVVFVLLDAAASPSLEAPGWGLRNFLCLLATHWRPEFGDSANILCVRGASATNPIRADSTTGMCWWVYKNDF